MTTEIHDPKSPYYDPSLSEDAQRQLTVREYPGIGASDLDRNEVEAVDYATAVTSIHLSMTPIAHQVPGGEVCYDMATAVATVMTEDEVDSWLNPRNEPGDRLAAAQNCLADMIFGRRFIRRSLGSATLDIDGNLADLYQPVYFVGDAPIYVPQTYFVEVSPTGLLARAGFRPENCGRNIDGESPEPAVALATTFMAVDHYRNKRGGNSLSFFRSDKGDPTWHIPRMYFPTIDMATEARDQLRQAVHTQRRPRLTAVVPDTPHDDRPSPTVGA